MKRIVHDLSMEGLKLLTKIRLFFLKVLTIKKIAGISEKLLLSFSVLTNGKKIFSAQENADRFAVLHGIKFLSMSWIILGHSYLFVYQYAGRSESLACALL